MPLQEPQSANDLLRGAPRWKKVLFYTGLVVLIVALNYLAARNEGRQKPEASVKTTTADRKTTPSDKSGNHAGAEADERSPTAKSSSGGGKQNNGANSRLSGALPKPTTSGEGQLATGDTDGNLIARNMRIRSEDGRVIYSGDVDLQPTLDRIERGKRLRFPNDGVVFENRERRLPAKSSGYYHEYVLPTRGDDGPGPQRIVKGSEGEVYYTPDHYKSFRRIK